MPQFAVPKGYTSDSLINNEIGWKTEWFVHRLQWNGALYRENRNNVQVSFPDPGVACTETCNSVGADCTPVVNPFGPIGAPTAFSPPMQFSVRALRVHARRRLTAIHSSKRCAQRAFVHAGRFKPNHRGARIRQHDAIAIRESTLHQH